MTSTPNYVYLASRNEPDGSNIVLGVFATCQAAKNACQRSFSLLTYQYPDSSSSTIDWHEYGETELEGTTDTDYDFFVNKLVVQEDDGYHQLQTFD